MTVGLTLHQGEMLAYIKAHIDTYDVFPTYREIAAGVGKASMSYVFEGMASLEARGFIERVRTKQCRRPWKLKQPRTGLAPGGYERGYKDGFEAGRRSIERELI